MALALPFLLLVGGEIVLALLVARVLWWVLRGWRGAFPPDPPPLGPPRPRGRPALVGIEGAAGRAEPLPELRAAA